LEAASTAGRARRSEAAFVSRENGPADRGDRRTNTATSPDPYRKPRRRPVMLEALKKLVGMDKDSAEARKQAAELERQEREARVAQRAEALKHQIESDDEPR
jgi:hypothetical protein